MRVLVYMPNFYSHGALRTVNYGQDTAVHIPSDPRTRAHFDEIDAFVKENYPNENYKPLWRGENLLINFSRWCTYEILRPDGKREPMPPGTYLGPGMYSAVIQASHIYLGPHKNGETCSVSLHIVGLVYEPEQNLHDIFDDIVKSLPPSPQPAVPATKLKAPRRKGARQKKKNGLDEVDSTLHSVRQ